MENHSWKISPPDYVDFRATDRNFYPFIPPNVTHHETSHRGYSNNHRARFFPGYSRNTCSYLPKKPRDFSPPYCYKLPKQETITRRPYPPNHWNAPFKRVPGHLNHFKRNIRPVTYQFPPNRRNGNNPCYMQLDDSNFHSQGNQFEPYFQGNHQLMLRLPDYAETHTTENFDVLPGIWENSNDADIIVMPSENIDNRNVCIAISDNFKLVTNNDLVQLSQCDEIPFTPPMQTEVPSITYPQQDSTSPNTSSNIQPTVVCHSEEISATVEDPHQTPITEESEMVIDLLEKAMNENGLFDDFSSAGYPMLELDSNNQYILPENIFDSLLNQITLNDAENKSFSHQLSPVLTSNSATISEIESESVNDVNCTETIDPNNMKEVGGIQILEIIDKISPNEEHIKIANLSVDNADSYGLGDEHIANVLLSDQMLSVNQHKDVNETITEPNMEPTTASKSEDDPSERIENETKEYNLRIFSSESGNWCFDSSENKQNDDIKQGTKSISEDNNNETNEGTFINDNKLNIFFGCNSPTVSEESHYKYSNILNPGNSTSQIESSSSSNTNYVLDEPLNEIMYCENAFQYDGMKNLQRADFNGERNPECVTMKKRRKYTRKFKKNKCFNNDRQKSSFFDPHLTSENIIDPNITLQHNILKSNITKLTPAEPNNYNETNKQILINGKTRNHFVASNSTTISEEPTFRYSNILNSEELTSQMESSLSSVTNYVLDEPLNEVMYHENASEYDGMRNMQTPYFNRRGNLECTKRRKRTRKFKKNNCYNNKRKNSFFNSYLTSGNVINPNINLPGNILESDITQHPSTSKETPFNTFGYPKRLRNNVKDSRWSKSINQTSQTPTLNLNANDVDNKRSKINFMKKPLKKSFSDSFCQTLEAGEMPSKVFESVCKRDAEVQCDILHQNFEEINSCKRNAVTQTSEAEANPFQSNPVGKHDAQTQCDMLNLNAEDASEIGEREDKGFIKITRSSKDVENTRKFEKTTLRREVVSECKDDSSKCSRKLRPRKSIMGTENSLNNLQNKAVLEANSKIHLGCNEIRGLKAITNRLDKTSNSKEKASTKRIQSQSRNTPKMNGEKQTCKKIASKNALRQSQRVIHKVNYREKTSASLIKSIAKSRYPGKKEKTSKSKSKSKKFY